MPKIKTHKATAKRYKKTGTNKLLRRKAGQDHFNSRESGKTKRNKRRDIPGNATFTKTIKNLMPYN
jgi:large subunit ribosomal protein L35